MCTVWEMTAIFSRGDELFEPVLSIEADDETMT